MPKSASVQIERKEMLYFTEDVAPDGEDPLTWWRRNRARFPLMASLARQYLCVPATSVPAEHVFSVCGLVVNKLRCRLFPENVDALVFLCKN